MPMPMLLRQMLIRSFLLFFLNILAVSLACLGYSSAGGGDFFQQSRSSALARGAPNARVGERGFRTEKCQRADFGVYKATELRHLATIYEFPMENASKSVEAGGNLSCNFDSVEENCAWYATIPVDAQRKAQRFRRARFETFFDWQKFDCTSDRTFTFEEFFLVIGGRDNSLQEISGAIEARIPCQLDKAMLKFDYWSNNETPVLKICVLPEDEPNAQCEETKMDANPLTFEIPESMKPFRLRIQIDQIMGRDDIAFIDNVQYDGKICGSGRIEGAKSGEEGPRKMAGTFGRSTITTASASTDYAVMEQKGRTTEAMMSTEEEEEESDNRMDVYLDEEDEEGKGTKMHDGEIHSKENLGMDEGGVEGQCRALSCNFDLGHSCEYNLSGAESNAPWKIGTGPLGNPHTGIHKGAPTDPKLVGYAYVGGGDDAKGKIFVMESPQIDDIADGPIVLTFDIFHRSVGPELKVCLNSLHNCPYVNPSKPSTSKYWLTEQRVILRKGTQRVYFVASKMRQNLYLAIDNIQLETIDFKKICGGADDSIKKS